jgi:plastocyanin
MRTKAWVIAAAIVCAAACSKSNGNSSASNGTTGSGGDTPTSPGYGGTTCDDPTPGSPATVNANPCLDYNPAQITVAVGTTVSFVFGSTAHTVTFPIAGSPASIPATSNATVTRTFTTAGSFGYFCTIHPYMNGTIVVQ